MPSPRMSCESRLPAALLLLGMLTHVASKMSKQTTSKVTIKFIFSRVEDFGPSLRELLDGPTIAPCFRAPARVSHTLPPASEQEPPTTDTCGLSSSASFEVGDRLSSLESRLRDRLAAHGSTKWPTIWKETTTPSGRSILRLSPSGVVKFGNDSGLWPALTASRRCGLQSHGRNLFLGPVSPLWAAWHMGFPNEWTSCALQAMRSIPASPRK